MGVIQAGSLADRIRQVVLRLGECSLTQLVGELGTTIPAARAACAAQGRIASTIAYRKGTARPQGGGSRNKTQWSTDEIVALGRRRLIQTGVDALFKGGFLERVRPGVYRPTTKDKQAYQPRERKPRERKERVKRKGGVPPGCLYPDSFANRVLQTIAQLGECTNKQIAAQVAAYLPAAKAATSGRTQERFAHKRHRNPRPKSVEQLVKYGLAVRVAGAIHRLLRQGHVVRVRKGVYRLAPPRINTTNNHQT